LRNTASEAKILGSLVKRGAKSLPHSPSEARNMVDTIAQTHDTIRDARDYYYWGTEVIQPAIKTVAVVLISIILYQLIILAITSQQSH